MVLGFVALVNPAGVGVQLCEVPRKLRLNEGLPARLFAAWRHRPGREAADRAVAIHIAEVDTMPKKQTCGMHARSSPAAHRAHRGPSHHGFRSPAAPSPSMCMCPMANVALLSPGADKMIAPVLPNEAMTDHRIQAQFKKCRHTAGILSLCTQTPPICKSHRSRVRRCHPQNSSSLDGL